MEGFLFGFWDCHGLDNEKFTGSGVMIFALDRIELSIVDCLAYQLLNCKDAQYAYFQVV